MYWFTRILLGILLAAYLSMGAVQLVSELGDPPAYGDTLEYLILATRGAVDEYRGMLYPVLLGGADRLLGGRILEGFRGFADLPLTDVFGPLGLDPVAYRGQGFPGPPGALIWVQLAQILVFALASAYAIWVLAPGAWARAFLLAAVLWLDPVILHMQLSILTDGLALSALVLVGAGLAHLAVDRPRAWLGWVAVVAGGLTAMLLRNEKAAVLLGAGISMAVLAWGLRRGRGFSGARSLALVVGLLAVVGLGWTVQRAWQEPSGRWPKGVAWLHERVIYPHLTSIQPHLPATFRPRIGLKHAQHHDASIRQARRVMIDLMRRTPERLETVSETLARAVVREQPLDLARDVGSDALGNVFSTIAFYASLGRWFLAGASDSAWVDRFETAPWTWHVMSAQHARWTAVRLMLLAALAAVGSCLGLASLWRQRRRPWWKDPEVVLRISPFVLLATVNALVFTAASALVHVRYGLPSHGLFVVAALAPVVAMILPSRRGVPKVVSQHLDKDFQRAYWASNTNARAYDHPVVRFFVQQRIDFLTRHVDLQSVSSALDVGCGDGFATFYLDQILDRVDGGDISPLMLEHNPMPRDRLMVFDAERLPIGDGSYDLVSTWEVLHHMPHPDRVVREMARVSRRWVVIFEPNRNNLLQFLFGTLVREERGTLRSTRSYLKGLCEDCDLELVALDYCGKIPPNKTPELALRLLRNLPFESNVLTGISIAAIAQKRGSR